MPELTPSRAAIAEASSSVSDPRAAEAVERHRLEGQRLLADNLPLEARRQLFEAYAIDARNAEVCRAIGKTYLPTQEHNRAKLWFEAAAALQPGYAAPWCDLGLLELRGGQLETAITLFEQALRSDATYFPAWGGLATARGALQQHGPCLEAAEEALRLHPSLPNLHGLRGIALEQLGRPEEARLAYETELAGNPGANDALNRLLALLKSQGKLEDAIAVVRATLEQREETAGDALVLGELHQLRGELAEAEAALRRALALAPQQVMASINLSDVLCKGGRIEEAKAVLEERLAHNPQQAAAHINIGSILMEEGRLQEAEQAMRRALALAATLSDSNQAKAEMNLGSILARQGRPREAMAALRRAITLDPELADAHYNLGVVLHQEKKVKEAAASLKRALELHANHSLASFALGHTLRERGHHQEALECYAHSAALLPDELLPMLSSLLYLSHTAIAESVSAIRASRQDYLRGIADLTNSMLAEKRTVGMDLCNGNFDNFWLAYHNEPDDREILEALGNALHKHSALQSWIQPANVLDTKPRQGTLRLGICSEHLLDSHTIGRQFSGLLKGWAEAGLHTVVLTSAAVNSASTHRDIATTASQALALPNRERDASALIRDLDLDVLFYPDIGMSPFTYLLSLARLAPVQVTSWGHPLTTGSPCMDYYLSSTLLEPEGAREHYSEQLVCLSRLPCTYAPLDPLPSVDLRVSFGLDAHAPTPLPERPFWIGIPQTLFKFHPDYDATLEAIATAIPTGVFVLLEGQRPHWSAALRRRWQATAPQVLSRSVFLPQVSRERYLQLVDAVDLLLDPFFFGSGNTFYEAMASGTPVVTLPGRAMRGRVVAAAYKQMGVADPPIATSPDDYVAWCCRLAADPELRRDLKQRLRSAATSRLFNDTAVHQEFLEFFHAAVAAARRGEKLPPGWSPTPSPFPSHS